MSIAENEELKARIEALENAGSGLPEQITVNFMHQRVDDPTRLDRLEERIAID